MRCVSPNHGLMSRHGYFIQIMTSFGDFTLALAAGRVYWQACTPYASQKGDRK